VSEGPADADAVEAFMAACGRAAIRLVDPPLPTLAGVLATARAYLGNDSGVSHLAASVGAPSLILFVEQNRPWVPWSPTARCVTVTVEQIVPTERAAVRAALHALMS
jgi:heptosyltransferase III